MYTEKGMPHCYFVDTDTRANKMFQIVNLAPLRHILGPNHDDAMQYVKTLWKKPKCEELTKQIGLLYLRNPVKKTNTFQYRTHFSRTKNFTESQTINPKRQTKDT